MAAIGGSDGRSGMKTDLELRHLRIFIGVVESGSHSGAARALSISQSTVSENLGALERSLGTVLFHKTSRGAVLTGAGDALLPYARRMLALTGELAAALTKVSATASATLRVAAVESVSTYVLPSRVAKLRERWPNARIEVVTAVCREIRASVAGGRADLGLVLEEAADTHDDDVLAHGRLLIVAAPGSAPARRAASPDQLGDREFFMSDAGGDYHRALQHWFHDAGMPPPRMQALGTIEGVKRGILAGGDALGLLPSHAVLQELRDGTLAQVRACPELPRLVLRAVVPPGKSAAPMLADLLAGLRGSALGGDVSIRGRASRAPA
jgi:DNA-binding transcriptional LysR family regulator